MKKTEDELKFAILSWGKYQKLILNYSTQNLQTLETERDCQ